MKYGEMMDSVFRILRKNFWPVWCFLFIINTPFQLLVEFNHIFEIPRIENIEIIVISIYLFVLYPVIQNALSQVVIHQYQQRCTRFSWQKLFSMASTNLGRIWATHILLVGLILLLILLIFLIVGGPFWGISLSKKAASQVIWPKILWLIGLLSIGPVSYLWLRLSLALPMITLEWKSVQESYVRSWRLTQRAYMVLCIKWISLALLLLPVFLFWLFIDSLQFSKIFLICVKLLMIPILLAMGPIFLSLIYIDQRARKEAFDLEMALKEVIKDPSEYRTGKKATTRGSF